MSWSRLVVTRVQFARRRMWDARRAGAPAMQVNVMSITRATCANCEQEFVDVAYYAESPASLYCSYACTFFALEYREELRRMDEDDAAVAPV